MKEYKKTYKELVFLILAYMIVPLFLSLILSIDSRISERLMLNLTTIWMSLLSWIIYKTEKIYWYTGMSYEKAAKASTESRKSYAIRHFQRFTLFTIFFVFYSAVSYILRFPIITDVCICTIGICATALSTFNIKLEG